MIAPEVSEPARRGRPRDPAVRVKVLTVAAAEAAIGLAILVCFFRNRGTIDVEDVNVMKG